MDRMTFDFWADPSMPASANAAWISPAVAPVKVMSGGSKSFEEVDPPSRDPVSSKNTRCIFNNDSFGLAARRGEIEASLANAARVSPGLKMTPCSGMGY